MLKLTASVDDTAWPSAATGALYTTDNGADTINRITGPFRRGSELVAVTPCDENGAPSTCPGPGFPANYLGEVNPDTGVISRVALAGSDGASAGHGVHALIARPAISVADRCCRVSRGYWPGSDWSTGLHWRRRSSSGPKAT